MGTYTFGKGLKKSGCYRRQRQTPETWDVVINMGEASAPNPKDCFPVFSTNSKVLEEFTDKTGTLIIVDEVSFG